LDFNIRSTRISVNIPTRAALETEIRARFAAGNGFALATINLDHLAKLAADPGFRSAYAAQDLVVADGNPIVWLSRLAGKPVELMPGSDLVVPLARLAADAGVGVALLGSTAEALDKAAESLRDAVPGLNIAAKLAPPFGFDPAGAGADQLFDALARSGACLTFLALGAPKQEILAARGRLEIPVMGYASIGAGLDFLAGSQTRAPRWVRALALEWLWRMMSSPRRLGPRYVKSALILPGHVLRALVQRRG